MVGLQRRGGVVLDRHDATSTCGDERILPPARSTLLQENAMQGMDGFPLGAVLACALLISFAQSARAQSNMGAQAGAPMMQAAVTTSANAQASASASATASGGAAGGGGSCSAESSAEAQAVIGNQTVQKSAHKRASQSGQGCNATAQSSASVHPDPQGDTSSSASGQ